MGMGGGESEWVGDGVREGTGRELLAGRIEKVENYIVI